MSKRKNTVIFSTVFVFVYVSKNSNLTGTRKFFISLQIAWILMSEGKLNFANAKDFVLIPEVHGFKPPISRRNPYNPKPINPALGGARPNTGKGGSSGANKPPRAPSGLKKTRFLWRGDRLWWYWF